MMIERLFVAIVSLVILQPLVFTNAYTTVDACTIESKSWKFRETNLIGYEVARNSPSNDNHGSKEPILLLNGFGVGSFHQHRLMPEILQYEEEDRSVYGLDYLGQGRSWPEDCQDGNAQCEKGLIYSADTWVDQIITFIEQVIMPASPGEKVHLVGNSVGGHLSVIIAGKRPDLIASITLLNATPVWGLNLPFWSGELPPPAIPRRIGRYLFDRIRDENTIQKYLEAAYVNPKAFDQELIQQIRGCTEGKGGHAAFASIMWSPPASSSDGGTDFYSMLGKLQCDTLLIFGKDDPWCKPAFAKRMMNKLSERSANDITAVSRYLQLDKVGHCPNHEAPKAVGKAVSGWIRASCRNRQDLKLVEGQLETFHEDWGDIQMEELGADEIEVSALDKVVARFL